MSPVRFLADGYESLQLLAFLLKHDKGCLGLRTSSEQRHGESHHEQNTIICRRHCFAPFICKEKLSVPPYVN
eukprot:scaffold126758_cov98-Cyclotella_meneghiniana.AAC.1